MGILVYDSIFFNFWFSLESVRIWEFNPNLLKIISVWLWFRIDFKFSLDCNTVSIAELFGFELLLQVGLIIWVEVKNSKK